MVLARFWLLLPRGKSNRRVRGRGAPGAGDRGLRTSKLQYLPAFLGAKVRVLARNELSPLETVPILKTDRLILDGLREEDKPLYNRRCLILMKALCFQRI